MISLILSALTAIGGAWLGLKFADIDLAPPLPFRHRSVWTHGPFPALLAVYLLGMFPSAYWFVVGFLLGNAIHLLADMFPRNWVGGATIKLYPIKKELAPILSFCWMFAGALLSVGKTFTLLGFVPAWYPWFLEWTL